MWRTTQDITELADEALLGAKRRKVKLTGPTEIDLDVNGRRIGFEHAASYKNEIAQHTVPYAIGKMVQAIKLKEDGTCEPS